MTCLINFGYQTRINWLKWFKINSINQIPNIYIYTQKYYFYLSSVGCYIKH